MQVQKRDTMAQTMVTIWMVEEFKKNFDAMCNELGLNISTAITVFAKKMSRENRIPFKVSVDPFFQKAISHTSQTRCSCFECENGR